jgi:histidyl-tRNA synthetase
MARALRTEGLGVEVYPEARRVGQQLQYAVRRGYRVALIAGPDEFAQGAWNVKDLAAGVQQEKVRTAEVPALIRSILEAPRIC